MKKEFSWLLRSQLPCFSAISTCSPHPPKRPTHQAVPAAEKAQHAATPAPAAVAQPQIKNAIRSSLQLPQAPIVDDGRNITVETGLFTALFVRASGGPASFTLHNYKEVLEPTAAERLMKKLFNVGPDFPADAGQKDKQLLHVRTAQDLPLRTLFIDAGSAILAPGRGRPIRDSLRLRDTAQQGAITFSQQDQQGLKLSKQFTFTDKDYKFGLHPDPATMIGSAARTGTPVIEWKAHVPGQAGRRVFRRRYEQT